MSFEKMFLLGCVSILVLITVGLIISTLMMNSTKFKRFQIWMSALQYDKEVDAKINLLINKAKEGLTTAKLEDGVIYFYTDVNTGRYEATINVRNKFNNYGFIQRINNSSSSITDKRGSIKTSIAVYDFEQELLNVNVKPKADNKVVELS